MKYTLKENTCRNCKYHHKFYEIRKAALVLVDGYCNNSHNRLKKREVITWNDCCKYWEKAEDEKPKRIESAMNTIADMNKTLKNIVLVLKESDADI